MIRIFFICLFGGFTVISVAQSGNYERYRMKFNLEMKPGVLVTSDSNSTNGVIFFWDEKTVWVSYYTSGLITIISKKKFAESLKKTPNLVEVSKSKLLTYKKEMDQQENICNDCPFQPSLYVYEITEAGFFFHYNVFNVALDSDEKYFFVFALRLLK